jgi:predicted ATPase
MQRVVITGGPSSGKTSIIDTLKEDGYAVFQEVARKVIQKQLKLGTNKVPWDDVSAFSKLVLKDQITQWNSIENTVAFYDRGIPDIIGYLNHGNKQLFNALKEASSRLRYDFVFILPPWRTIYTTDQERREDFKSAELIFEEIKMAYKKLNYSPITVPIGSVKERTRFIIDWLNE